MDVIKTIAKENGVSTKEVYDEMTKAIRAAKENPDPKVQMMWKCLFPNGKEPTPEKFINTLAEAVKSECSF